MPACIAVLSESTRIYPPVPTFNARSVPSGPGATIGSHHLPSGTVIHFNHYAAYHLSSNFTDPLTFAPERWLGDPRYENDNRDVLKPFAVGPRDCLGKNLAYAETRLVIARLLWRFDLRMAEGGRRGLEEWFEKQKSYVLWQKPPLFVKVRRREG